MILPSVVRSGVTPNTEPAPRVRDPEAGDHLVEQEQRPVFVAERAEPFEEPRFRRHHAHVRRDRLHDDHRDVAPAFGEDRSDRVQIVERRGDGVPRRSLRHAGRAGDAERGHTGSGTVREEGVGMAVVTAVELQQQVASRDAARQPDRAHRGLGSRRDETDHVDAGNGVDDPLGQFDLEERRRAERRASRGGRGRRLHDLGPRVSEEQRAPRLDVIHVAVAVRVEEVGAVPSFDEGWRAAYGAERPHRRIDAAGDHVRGAREEVVGCGHGHDGTCRVSPGRTRCLPDPAS